ncbi:GAF domain-containing protein [Neolewinella antarctica]|uniref:GAF domain-containing protein n=1 Tax=Neolewinella antarctica TaxID=442734 RepID=A0ABX0XI59_9BACT|nr:GAF domain-containing protein [Neolewinella antarctica]NJC28443.1 GAF domain-containing protein [Neolewinella antarctica]
MSATSVMPYFIKPSQNLSAAEKETAYATARQQILATLGEETDEQIKMVTVNCLLKTHLPYFYWVGFYLNRGDETLRVGPYQGTLGCLYIKFGRGVCGSVAQSGKTKIVANTHALEQGSEHIACDPNSQSEIVLPVLRADGSLLGVFDVDSTELGSFDGVDERWLTGLLGGIFGN